VSPDGDRRIVRELVERATTFDARGFYRRGRPTLHGYFVTYELLEGRLGTAGLARLVELVSSGRLRVEVGLEVPWTEAASAVTALLERRVRGKAVLTLGSS
jgi:NADPH:quinone reductase-like Zn-dependent oxidoreductase